MTDQSMTLQYLDLRGTPCPVNFIRCRLALEELHLKECIKIDIDTGEPEEMVIPGLVKEGYLVEIIYKDNNWLRLMVCRSEQ